MPLSAGLPFRRGLPGRRIAATSLVQSLIGCPALSAGFRGGQKMVLHRNRQPVIVKVVRKLLHDAGDEHRSAILRQRRELRGDRRCRHVQGNQSRGHRIAQRPMLETDVKPEFGLLEFGLSEMALSPAVAAATMRV
jgi:hypothetical protein